MLLDTVQLRLFVNVSATSKVPEGGLLDGLSPDNTVWSDSMAIRDLRQVTYFLGLLSSDTSKNAQQVLDVDLCGINLMAPSSRFACETLHL